METDTQEMETDIQLEIKEMETDIGLLACKQESLQVLCSDPLFIANSSLVSTGRVATWQGECINS